MNKLKTAIDLAILENAGKSATYPSEDKKHAARTPQNFTMIKGRKCYFDTVVITNPAHDTYEWDNNPRKFALRVDTSDLEPEIKAAGTNAVPVVLRLDATGKYQVIYGTRRRKACINTGASLTGLVYKDLSDDEAEYLANEENSDRKELDFFACCRYLRSYYQQLKKEHKIGSQEFVDNYAPNLLRQMQRHFRTTTMTRQNMSSIWSIADLPDVVMSAISQMDEWGMRRATKIRQIYNNIVKHEGNGAISAKQLQLNIHDKIERDGYFANPDEYINWLKEFLPNEGSAASTLNTRTFNIGGGSVEISSSPRGTSIKLPKDIPDAVLTRLESVLAEFSS